MIFEVRTFGDGANVIQAKYPSDPLGVPQFFATSWLKFGTPGGEMQVNFQFDIPGATAEEAFINFPAAFESAKVKAEAGFREQMAAQQNKIIVPGMPPGGRINGMAH